MNVSGTGSMEQMQMQMRKMDGSGGGHGQGGMKDIMQSLSSEDRTAMKEGLSSMSSDDRISTVVQMKEIDASTLSAEDYTQALLDLLNQTNTNDAENDSFSVYA